VREMTEAIFCITWFTPIALALIAFIYGMITDDKPAGKGHWWDGYGNKSW
jgi:hypothetical protein